MMLGQALAYTEPFEGLKYLASAGGHKVVAISSIGDNNYLAMATLMVMPMLFYATQYSAVRYDSIAFFGALLVCAVGVVAAASAPAWSAAVPAGLVFVLQRSRRKLAGLLVIAAFGTALVTLAPK